MRWPRAYVDLILRFAERAAELARVSYSQALLEWTPLYLNLGLGRSFRPDDSIWQEFLGGYQAATDPVAWTHSFYLAHAREYPSSPYGCFSYHYEPETQAIRIHFGIRDASGQGPLSEARVGARLGELSAMFADVHREVPTARFVRGGSWMYGLPSYRRLFPPEYVATATPVEPELQFMSLWGQFLDHRWELHPDRADAFRQALAMATTADELRRSFPMPVMALRADIGHFYEFYDVDNVDA